MRTHNAHKNTLLFGLAAGVLVFGSVFGVAAYSQDNTIPEWIKGLFAFWADEQVSDADLLSALEFLIDAGVIQTDQSAKIADLEKTVDDLQEENMALRAEIAKLDRPVPESDMMVKKSTTSPVFADTESPIQGSPDAEITLVEFGDYQCPRCKAWFVDTKPLIYDNYIQTGKVNMVFVDIAFIGDDSHSAAQASYCADDQGMYWEYHNMLYTSQSGPNSGWASVENLKMFASDMGLDAERFAECLDSKKYQERVEANSFVSYANDVASTPSFLIISSDGREFVSGAQPYSTFKSIFDSIG